MKARLQRAERAGGAEYAAMQQLFRSRLPTPKTAAAVEAASKAVPKAASAKPKPAVSQEQSAAVAAEPKPKPAAPVEPAAAVAAETLEQKKKALDAFRIKHAELVDSEKLWSRQGSELTGVSKEKLGKLVKQGGDKGELAKHELMRREYNVAAKASGATKEPPFTVRKYMGQSAADLNKLKSQLIAEGAKKNASQIEQIDYELSKRVATKAKAGAEKSVAAPVVKAAAPKAAAATAETKPEIGRAHV